MKSHELREKFLDFFEHKQHTRVRSDYLVPQKDPTLLFTTAGMVQFKSLWVGAPLNYSRATSVQKCLRAGGKGSDLENVGKTLRHHTFFEMLGNFSFGDYFKQEAIEWAWEFITTVLKIDTERLWVSVYKDDPEAAELWIKRIGFPKERVVFLGDADNFWGPAGETGACGPCSEIYIDLGADKDPSVKEGDLEGGGERYLEFWNLVFPQFDQQKDGSRPELARRGIDTGMGLERLTYIMQGVNSTYETDLFQPIIQKLSQISGRSYHNSKEEDYALHVIADHVRALTFAFSENILPSNEGRGYVLRRILRRAYRFGTKLGMKQPFICDLVPSVVDIMGKAYPEIASAQKTVQKMIQTEEAQFQSTLDSSRDLIEEVSQKAIETNRIISGKDIFKLYDTYGFPLDMLEEIAEEKEIQIDQAGFDQLMAEQKDRARKNWSGGKQSQLMALFQDVLTKYGPTQFCGYDAAEANSEAVALLCNDSAITSANSAHEDVWLFVKESPFYAESGGQAGDKGWIKGSQGEAQVLDTKKVLPELWGHRIQITQGSLSVKDKLELKIDQERRHKIASNHTATHILHSVLRKVLGEEVKQAGSLVEEDYLRFDFTYFSALKPSQLSSVEQEVNRLIRLNANTSIKEKSLEEAKEEGAIAFFDEKYGDQVRVVALSDFSQELCGGTHVNATGTIGLFKIVSESSVASGTRRIIAVTGEAAYQAGVKKESLLNSLSSFLKVSNEEILTRVEQLQTQVKEQERKLAKIEEQNLLSDLSQFDQKVVPIGASKILIAKASVDNPDLLKNLADSLKERHKGTVIVLAAQIDEKILFVASVSAELLAQKWHAGQLVKDLASRAGGGGGGRPDFAQAGAKSNANIDQLLKEFLEELKKARE